MKILKAVPFAGKLKIKETFKDFKSWEDFQDEFSVRANLKLREGELAVCHRFIDTKAAGNLVASQPGDHLLLRDGKVSVVDSKYSATHLSLIDCYSSMVSTALLGHFEKWSKAKANTWILFLGAGGDFEVWNGELLLYANRNGIRLRSLLPQAKRFDNYSEMFNYVWDLTTGEPQ